MAISQSVGRSIKKRHLYKGYRFWRLNRDQEIKEYKIPDTIELNRKPKYEQIVQLDPDGTKIVNIFSCPTNAAEEFSKTLDKDVKKVKKSITNNLSEENNRTAYGFRWNRISDVPKNLLDKYLETNELPKVTINKGQKSVYKFDSSKKLVETYNSMVQATKKEKFSDTTLRKAINNKTLLNEYYWSFSSKF
jgi:hypothetical protein